LVLEAALGSEGYANTILKAFDAGIISRLCLEPITFEVGHDIESPGNPIEKLFFLERGMASMTTSFRDGSQVEVHMFGYDGIVGVSALMGAERSFQRVFTQIAGHGFTSLLKFARREFHRGGPFRSLVLQCVQTQLVHTAQSAGCNAKHGVEQRLARWLLLCSERTNSKRFKLSQDFIAQMLAASRSTVSATATILKEAGLITYSRGSIHILDSAALEKRSCECYRIVKDRMDIHDR
jgi:CRP-like cAMP-binding protein